jgi:hypothetical protein
MLYLRFVALSKLIFIRSASSPFDYAVFLGFAVYAHEQEQKHGSNDIYNFFHLVFLLFSKHSRVIIFGCLPVSAYRWQLGNGL